jgi:hypothetical protein
VAFGGTSVLDKTGKTPEGQPNSGMKVERKTTCEAKKNEECGTAQAYRPPKKVHPPGVEPGARPHPEMGRPNVTATPRMLEGLASHCHLESFY